MVRGQHARELASGGRTDIVRGCQPIGDREVADGFVPCKPTLLGAGDAGGDRQPAHRHLTRQSRHLDGEGRAELADVVLCREPDGQLSRGDGTAGIRRDVVLDRGWEPIVPDEGRHRGRVSEVLIERQPSEQLARRVIDVRFGPGGSHIAAETDERRDDNVRRMLHALPPEMQWMVSRA